MCFRKMVGHAIQDLYCKVHSRAVENGTMWRLVAVNSAVLLVLLTATEASLAWLGTRSTPLGIEILDKIARKLYWANLSYVQFEPDCARYDQQLGYTLRPGTCIFESALFTTEISVNSAGLRDDEASLNAPQIIVLGDSQAMGWGVENGQTFADHIEVETGARTLNAGVSSYGTARELLMLERLDRRNLDTVIIQYSDNDAWENRTYLSTGTLEAMSQDTYQSLVESNAATTDGFGTYLPALIRVFRAEAAERTAASSDDTERDVKPLSDLPDQDVLLEILSTWEWDSPAPRIILLEVNTGGRGGGFMPALLSSPKFADLQSAGLEVVTLDTLSILDADDYLFPDGHLNADGQRKIGLALAQVLSELE